MRLEKAFLELNQVAEEVEKSIYNIYVTFFNNDEGFPYGVVQNLINKYELMRNKLYKKKNSSFNEFWSGISARRKENLNGLSALEGREILKQVSEKMIPQILENVNEYVPHDEESKMKIFDKLYPVMMNLSSSRISSVYKKIKSSTDDLGDMEATLLQQNFVSYIISVFSCNAANRCTRVYRHWTYEEVCKKILEEPVLSLMNIDKKGR